MTLTAADAAGGGVDLTVSIPAGQGDLLGVFGNVADEALLPSMAVSSPDGLITQWQFAANKVSKVGGGNVMNPVGTWDWGVRIGSQGSASGAVTTASFRLTGEGLDAAQLVNASTQGWVFGVRVQLAFGCEQNNGPEASVPHTNVLQIAARVDGDPIAVPEVRDVLPAARGDRRRAVDLVIARHLAAGEARKRGLDASPELAAQLEALRRDAAAREESLLRDALFASLRDEIALGEDELRAHYEKTKVRYSERQLRLRRQAFASAEAAREGDAKLGPAGRLDPGASEAIGPAAVAKLPQAVLPEVLRLREPGERAVVERDGSAALVELVEVIPAAAVPFEAVRDKVEASLRLQRAQEAFAKRLDELRAAAKIEIDEAVLREDSLWQKPPEPLARLPQVPR